MLQQRPNTFAQTILSLSFFACDEAADHTFRFVDNPPRILPFSATRYGEIKEMAAIGEGGHTNRALCVAYIFIGVA